MYSIYTYIRLIFMVNVDKYTIHGWYGIYTCDLWMSAIFWAEKPSKTRPFPIKTTDIWVPGMYLPASFHVGKYRIPSSGWVWMNMIHMMVFRGGLLLAWMCFRFFSQSMVVSGSPKRWDRWHSPSPIGRKNATYVPLIVLAEPGGRYMLPIPPFRGTRNNNHWVSHEFSTGLAIYSPKSWHGWLENPSWMSRCIS